MRLMWTAFVFAGLAVTQAAHALPGADTLPGTWECYGPGQHSPHTPPIVYFGDVQTEQGGTSTIFIDGFARAVNGRASLAAEPDALRVSMDSTSLLLRDLKQQGVSARMVLDRDGVGSYHCYRLPKSAEAVEEASAASPSQPKGDQPLDQKSDPSQPSGAAPDPSQPSGAAPDPSQPSGAAPDPGQASGTAPSPAR